MEPLTLVGNLAIGVVQGAVAVALVVGVGLADVARAVRVEDDAGVMGLLLWFLVKWRIVVLYYLMFII
jgi:hypothetical protein